VLHQPRQPSRRLRLGRRSGYPRVWQARLATGQRRRRTQWYTGSFSGTSSASPIVAGAVALIEGIRKKLGMSPLNSTEMRSLLRSTGAAQGAGVAIGTQPNLQAALRSTLPDDATVQLIGLPDSVTPGQTVTGTVIAGNNGPLTWTSSSHQVVWLGGQRQPRGSQPNGRFRRIRRQPPCDMDDHRAPNSRRHHTAMPAHHRRRSTGVNLRRHHRGIGQPVQGTNHRV
jgi:hypothetical protein